MDGLNEKLKEITLAELIVIFFVFYILILLLGIAEQWIYLVIIAYVLFRLKNQLPDVKSSIANVPHDMPVKTLLLLSAAGYVFALGSGWFLNDFLSTSYNMMSSFNSADLIMDFAFSVIIAPIAEEIMFRGIVLNRLQKIPFIVGFLICTLILLYLNHIVALMFIIIVAVLFLLNYFKKYIISKEFGLLMIAILASSLLFAILHSYSAIVSTTLFGITMAIAYLKTDNIFVPISIHMMNNLLSFIISPMPFMENLFENNIFIAVLAILTIISAVYIIKFIITGVLEIKKKKS